MRTRRGGEFENKNVCRYIYCIDKKFFCKILVVKCLPKAKDPKAKNIEKNLNSFKK